MNEYTDYLLSLKDEKYGDFTYKLIPGSDRDKIIGVRMPLIRKYAKYIVKNCDYTDFINSLPHCFHEENLLHICIISLLKDYDKVTELTEKFLPYIDNWAVCDSFNPQCFKNNKQKLIENVTKWLDSDLLYTKRFAIDMLMNHFLDSDYNSEYLTLVASAEREDYYLKMAVAWFFATALSKQYDDAVIFIEEKKLEKWTHNKTIQKACESYRISEDKKDYLRTLKIR